MRLLSWAPLLTTWAKLGMLVQNSADVLKLIYLPFSRPRLFQAVTIHHHLRLDHHPRALRHGHHKLILTTALKVRAPRERLTLT